MTLDPELFPALNYVPTAAAPVAPVPVGNQDGITAGSITDYDSRLISDLVANIRFQADVLKQYGITPEQFAQKLANPAFMAHWRETARLWNSDLNTTERIRAKAAFILEDSLPELGRIAKNAQTPVNAKIAAMEQLAKISTVSHVPKDVGHVAEKHSITINIGGGREPVTINAETTSK